MCKFGEFLLNVFHWNDAWSIGSSSRCSNEEWASRKPKLRSMKYSFSMVKIGRGENWSSTALINRKVDGLTRSDVLAVPRAVARSLHGIDSLAIAFPIGLFSLASPAPMMQLAAIMNSSAAKTDSHTQESGTECRASASRSNSSRSLLFIQIVCRFAYDNLLTKYLIANRD